MKHTIVLLLLVAGTAVAQSSAPPSLELGKLKVHLGMTKADVLSKAAQVGYKIHLDETTGYATIDKGEDTRISTDSIRFKGDRVVFATRTWKSGQLDDWRALMGALSTVDHRMCRVFSSHKSDPGLDYTSYFLDCGEHGLYIEESIFGNGLRVTDVGEIIGDPEGRPLPKMGVTKN